MKKPVTKIKQIGLLFLAFFLLSFLLIPSLNTVRHNEDSSLNVDAVNLGHKTPVSSMKDRTRVDSSRKEESVPPAPETLQVDLRKNPGDTAAAGKRPKAKPYVEHEILVRFASKVSPAKLTEILADHDMTVVRMLMGNHLAFVRLPETRSVAEAERILRKVPGVLFSEPNYIVHTTSIPDDSSFSNQWGFQNTGAGGGTNDADIDAVEAWDKSTGSSSIVVAVVDEGIDYTHPDLAGNIWTNPNEIPGNGIDDDGNGFIDDVHGWDFNHNDATTYDGASEDRHGTEVAGVIGAVGNNGVGVAGVCWNVRIMSVKFISYGNGTVADAISALEYAAKEGARVVNCSWGGTSYSAALESAFRDLENAGVLVVTSAGNSGKNTDLSSHYPSNYDLPNIISVAATDRNDLLSSFSNYGVTTVDLGAPGSSIYTTAPGGNYAYFSGTSAASPFVTGAAALALSVFPNLTYQELKDQILNHVDPIASLTGKTVTGGRLNVNNLVSALSNGDSDGDGMPNGFESRYGLNPLDASDANADADGDGLTNLQEYRDGTSPVNKDSDGDGLSDGFEVTYHLDPTDASDASKDLDGDGLSNLTEYEAGMAVNNVDSDHDGIDDFTEYGPRQFASDSDGDGIIDALDTDSDNDGRPDAEEGTGDDDNDGIANYVDMNDSDGPSGDQDGDGLSNSLEVTYMFYPNRVDSDNDGIDDRTEFGPNATPLDTDGDGIYDALDTDSDNDGKTDLSEGTGDSDGDGVPNYRDSDDSDGPVGDADGDGLSNQLEARFGLNTNLADSDGDGISDGEEFGTGDLPLDTDGDGIIDALDTDSDNDGALDINEGDLDSDGDGIPDRLDANTATLLTGSGALSLILGKGARLKDVLFIARPRAEADIRNIDFPYGGVQFKVSGLEPGAAVTMTLKTSAVLPSNAEYWKEDGNGNYARYDAVINGNTLQFVLTDGGTGDNDGVADGSISDPGYIGIPVAAESPSVSSGGGGGGGGGGGSGGCALSTQPVPPENGLIDLVLLLLPLGFPATRRLSVLLGHKRFRS
ncbi:MAG: S8 family serine peptidase [Deltaproteobacteria bacterium]|nr:S8 family serine peptidase [Deltaproteobacteria bacterium]